MSAIAQRRPASSAAAASDWLEPADDASSDPMSFRQSVSRFATGIVVLTCEDDDGSVHGATVNSFTSVSLLPPTVLVSLKPGRAHRLISRTGRYGASILGESQQRFSTHFSGRPEATLSPAFITRDRLPTLRTCLAWFECAVIERIQVHDHTLFIGEVTACGKEDGDPLIFYGSRYVRAQLEV
jgi:flavin reductase (DIM6/NTAB) family NADH-FMN oxidoreductase RutF